ncbi:Molybdopterin adenylyltransferase [hydrothermal vent metagenome]|uniref:Molybdopterin adenylyltransferase n=1 Tax=hydrothermal vent metagenome TaxID=652676 RepID=A0A3B0QNE3_9ZZZZ
MDNKNLKIGIVTVSDRASRGEYEDKGGPAVVKELTEAIVSAWEPVLRIVPDDQSVIEETLTSLADSERCSLIITTGGTGPAPRDLTPDATHAVATRELPGFGEQMRAISLKKGIPTAILSRQCAVLRNSTLIINLPGKPSAIAECLEAVLPAIPDCINLIGGPEVETNPDKVRQFHPHKNN